MDELRLKAKELGIKSYWNKKEDRLRQEIEEKLPKFMARHLSPVVGIDIDNKEDRSVLDKLNANALERYAKEMGGDKLIYKDRKKAFECYQGDRFIDHLSITMFQ